MTDCKCPRMCGALLYQPQCPVHGSSGNAIVTITGLRASGKVIYTEVGTR